MKKITLLFSAIVLMTVVSCRHNDNEALTPESSDANNSLRQKSTITTAPQGEPLSHTDLDKTINSIGAAHHDFKWQWIDLKTLWSAVQYNNHTLAVGYKPIGYGDISGIIHKINIHDTQWLQVHDALINLVLNELVF